MMNKTTNKVHQALIENDIEWFVKKWNETIAAIIPPHIATLTLEHSSEYKVLEKYIDKLLTIKVI